MFDSILHRDIRFGDGLTKRIEVDADEVYLLYSVVAQLLHVIRNIPARKKGTVNLWMKGLYTTIANLGESRDITHTGHRQTCLPQHLHGAASRKDFPSERHKFAGEINDTRFVTNTD